MNAMRSPPPPADHDRDLAAAFDAQAARFERAAAMTDAAALRRLVAFADLAPGARVLDGGCGPGLVAEAFLEAGHEVLGVDLSAEMIARARARCERFGARARFEHRSIYALDAGEPFDAAVSRLVLHHVEDPLRFLAHQARRVRPGGAIVATDHVTDPVPDVAAWHQEIERARDRTHVRNLTAGEVVDLFGRAGLADVRLVEERYELDFDEWFDRGSPARPKADVRARLLSGPRARSYAPVPQPDGRVVLSCVRVLVAGRRPA
jgi:SAM-dependent methyltransferase